MPLAKQSGPESTGWAVEKNFKNFSKWATQPGVVRGTFCSREEHDFQKTHLTASIIIILSYTSSRRPFD